MQSLQFGEKFRCESNIHAHTPKLATRRTSTLYSRHPPALANETSEDEQYFYTLPYLCACWRRLACRALKPTRSLVQSPLTSRHTWGRCWPPLRTHRTLPCRRLRTPPRPQRTTRLSRVKTTRARPGTATTRERTTPPTPTLTRSTKVTEKVLSCPNLIRAPLDGLLLPSATPFNNQRCCPPTLPVSLYTSIRSMAETTGFATTSAVPTTPHLMSTRRWDVQLGLRPRMRGSDRGGCANNAGPVTNNATSSCTSTPK